MDPTTLSRDELEAQVRTLIEADELQDGADLALKYYGPEVFGFLMGMLNDEDVANDVFQTFSVDFWRGIAKFQWRSSLRTWCYRLARSAASRYLRSPARRFSSLGDKEDELRARWTRTATAIWRKTEAKARLWEVCEGLDPDDRAVLILRVSRKMSWREIAEADLGDQPDADAVKKRAATLRKRFERIKEKVREDMQRWQKARDEEQP